MLQGSGETDSINLNRARELGMHLVAKPKVFAFNQEQGDCLPGWALTTIVSA